MPDVLIRVIHDDTYGNYNCPYFDTLPADAVHKLSQNTVFALRQLNLVSVSSKLFFFESETSQLILEWQVLVKKNKTKLGLNLPTLGHQATQLSAMLMETYTRFMGMLIFYLYGFATNNTGQC